MFEKKTRTGVVKTSLIGTLFPKLPSERELEERRRASRREIVQAKLGGFVKYVTEEEIEQRRKLLIDKIENL